MDIRGAVSIPLATRLAFDRSFVFTIDGEEKALPKKQKCEYCSGQATKRVIHSEGMAYIPACDGHLGRAKYDASHSTPDGGADASNIDRVDDIKAASIDTDPDPSPKPGAARLRQYWVHGEGAAKIRWGTHGDFNRCVRQLRKYVGTQAEGLCNVYHRSAIGAAPGHGHGKSAEGGMGMGFNIALPATLEELSRKVVTIATDVKEHDERSAKPRPTRTADDAREDRTHAAASKKPAPKKKGGGDEDHPKKGKGNGDFEGKHPRNPDGTFKYVSDSGKGDVGSGTKDKHTVDGKVTGRISAAQQLLVKMGFLDAKAGHKGHAVDGLFGPKTKAAVLALQKKKGLKPTGKLDAATFKALGLSPDGKPIKGAAKAPAKKPAAKPPTRKPDAKPAPKTDAKKPAKKEDGISITLQTKDGDNMNGIEYKCVGVSGVKSIGAKEDGIVRAYVSVTGIVDNVKDVIEVGAYEKTLQTRTPKGVWHHSWTEPVARAERVKELRPGDNELPKTLANGDPWPAEAGALMVECKFNLKTQRGRDAYEDVLFFGDEQEWSIGYNVPADGAKTEGGIRYIKTLELFEFSPVLFGAMSEARTGSVKEAQLAHKALELVLNGEDAGSGMKSWLAELEEKGYGKKKPKADEEDQGMDENDPEEEMDDSEGTAEDSDQGMEDEEDTPKKKGKGNKSLTPSEGALIQKAIDALVELRDSISTDENMPSEDMQEEKSFHMSDWTKSLEDEITSVLEDEEVATQAKAFDDAYEAQDLKAMEEAGTAVLDAIDNAISTGTDPEEFSGATTYIAEAVQNVADSQGDEEDATDDQDAQESEDGADDTEDTGSGEKMLTLNVNELPTDVKDLLAGLTK